jgi:hypothetical protein
MESDRNPRTPDDIDRAVVLMGSFVLELAEYVSFAGFDGFMVYLEQRPCLVCQAQHPDPPTAATVRHALNGLTAQLRKLAAS